MFLNRSFYITTFSNLRFIFLFFFGKSDKKESQQVFNDWIQLKKGLKPLSYLSSNFLQFINATSVFNHECCTFPACSRSLRLLQLGCLDFEILLSKVTLYARNKHYCFTVIIVSVTASLLFVEEKKTFQSGGAKMSPGVQPHWSM